MSGISNVPSILKESLVIVTTCSLWADIVKLTNDNKNIKMAFIIFFQILIKEKIYHIAKTFTCCFIKFGIAASGA